MASSLTLPTLQPSITQKSQFLGQPHRFFPQKPSPKFPQAFSTFQFKTHAKFNLSELLGGRGLCNGEEGLQQELKRDVPKKTQQPKVEVKEEVNTSPAVEEDAFEKELLGLTGGFPGGEKGLQKFIAENPPPAKSPEAKGETELDFSSLKTKAKPPELPVLLPGMIAIVKNPNNPYYMYCGIVQRITDGKAGVLFEGGNWDRLITFQLDELERREKGPPMVNPRSVVLEAMLEKES
ncbi:NADH dehydrogenase-like complex, subunit S [Dillenia turbinata]|uniref:NADH dehydrogenase-like complex, subunit S n=1 Tax=Dillenia turbinata TaxID=194707 RepID=A0AAN8ZSF0_9MAGN